MSDERELIEKLKDALNDLDESLRHTWYSEETRDERRAAVSLATIRLQARMVER